MSGAEILLEPGVIPRLLQGLWVTVWIAGVSVALSVPVGLIVGWLMTMKNPVVRVLTRIYLDFIRIMPQLALLFIAFYGFAQAWNWNLDATGACVFVFVLWGGAELGDLVRGALESIPKAQYESSYVLGLSGWQTFTKVILPQALRRLLPASVNLATRIVKTTSLAVLLGVVEVIKVGQQIIDANRFQYPTGTLWITERFSSCTSSCAGRCPSWPAGWKRGGSMTEQVEQVTQTAQNSGKSQTSLEIRHLVKRYANADKPVLDDISFDVPHGKVFVIVGPSGSGKSTLLRTIAGLEPIQGGTIALNGEIIETGKPGTESAGRSKRSSELRTRVGMVFQSYDLFPNKTVLGNITLAPTLVQKRDKAEAEQEAIALLERVGLADRKDAWPHELSGGQRQRVAICRALILHPEVLLFDEVTAALDPEMVREVLDVMLELADSGQTMLIVTHEMQFARAIADQVIMLEDGGIVEQSDDAEAFFTNPKTERAKRFLHTFEFDRHRRPAETPTEPTGTSAE